jgi:hypothetical protein
MVWPARPVREYPIRVAPEMEKLARAMASGSPGTGSARVLRAKPGWGWEATGKANSAMETASLVTAKAKRATANLVPGNSAMANSAMETASLVLVNSVLVNSVLVNLVLASLPKASQNRAKRLRTGPARRPVSSRSPIPKQRPCRLRNE